MKSPTTGEKWNSTPFFKKDKKVDPGNYWLVTLTLVLSKIMEQNFLEDTPRHVDDKEVIWDSQHISTKGKLFLTHWVVFYDGLTALVDEERAAVLLYLNCCKAFDIIFFFLIWKDTDFTHGLFDV